MLQNTLFGMPSQQCSNTSFGSIHSLSEAEILAEDTKQKETAFHKILKNLCIVAENRNPDVNVFGNLKNWSHLKKYDFVNQEQNLLCRVFKNNNKIVIVYLCSFPKFSLEDISAHLMRGWAIPQFKEAFDFYKFIKKTFNKESIYLTGCNMGGSTAQFVGLYNKDAATVTFNALGLGRLYPQIANSYIIPNIINYVSSCAPKMLREKHLGTLRMVFVVKSSLNQSKVTSPYQNHVLNEFENLQFFKTTCNSVA